MAIVYPRYHQPVLANTSSMSHGTMRCFGTIKTELEMTEYQDSLIARRVIADYLCYFNTQRKHFSLDYLTPKQFESNNPKARPGNRHSGGPRNPKHLTVRLPPRRLHKAPATTRRDRPPIHGRPTHRPSTHVRPAHRRPTPGATPRPLAGLLILPQPKTRPPAPPHAIRRTFTGKTRSPRPASVS